MDNVDFNWASHRDLGWDRSIRSLWLASLLVVDAGVVRFPTRDTRIAGTALPKEPLVWLGGWFRGSQERG